VLATEPPNFAFAGSCSLTEYFPSSWFCLPVAFRLLLVLFIRDVNEAKVEAETYAYKAEAKYNEAKAKAEAKLLIHTSTRLFQHQYYVSNDIMTVQTSSLHFKKYQRRF